MKKIKKDGAYVVAEETTEIQGQFLEANRKVSRVRYYQLTEDAIVITDTGEIQAHVDDVILDDGEKITLLTEADFDADFDKITP